MMDTLLNIIPTMMPLMAGGGGGSSENIIKQMERDMEREKPSVQVVDDPEDDDLSEALQEALHPSSVSKNHDGALETIVETDE